jgi:hypothetical protein
MMGRVKALYQQLIEYNLIREYRKQDDAQMEPAPPTVDDINKMAQRAAELDKAEQESA